MSRKKLSEYRAKKIISDSLGIDYVGWSLPGEQDPQGYDKYVVKVDQGIKGRFKKGLVRLGVAKQELDSIIEELQSKGYESFIVEPQLSHEAEDEKYLCITSDKVGKKLSFSNKGGIDIESNAKTIGTVRLNKNTDLTKLAKQTTLTEQQLAQIIRDFDSNFMTFLEINPYVVQDGRLVLLDLAIEVDDTASYFVKTWSEQDFRSSSSRRLTGEEKLVRELDENSPASLKLEVLNPDGSIFLLLSGGGASVVVADEVHNLGLGKQLANYGEYSGNPNTEETFVYTRELLNLLLKSSAPRKVLFIGGAVANFTDIASTFTGIIQAIEELYQHLQKQNVKVFVRRGGPRQEIGLAKIREVLDKYGLLGAVHDPSTPLTDAVAEAVKEVA